MRYAGIQAEKNGTSQTVSRQRTNDNGCICSCIACKLCEAICPAQAITIEAVRCLNVCCLFAKLQCRRRKLGLMEADERLDTISI